MYEALGYDMNKMENIINADSWLTTYKLHWHLNRILVSFQAAKGSHKLETHQLTKNTENCRDKNRMTAKLIWKVFVSILLQSSLSAYILRSQGWNCIVNYDCSIILWTCGWHKTQSLVITITAPFECLN